MTYASIDDLRSQLGKPEGKKHSPEYLAKMWHEVPDATTVDRAAFILERVKGKRVLEFGASGPMHEAIVKAAAHCFGVDRESNSLARGFDWSEYRKAPTGAVFECDLDGIGIYGGEVGPDLPDPGMVEVVVCGEVIEHLSNPGWFLTRLRRQFPGVPVIITVPNAFSEAGNKYIRRGVEMVNRDHVAWYSWKTLSVLVERVGYRVVQFHWYQGKPGVAEGLIFVVE